MQLKEKHPIYVSKECCEEKHVDLLLIGKEGKRDNVLTKYFNTFMYDHSLHRWGKHFCCYCLHAFITEEILKCHINDYFKTTCKQIIIISKKREYVKFKNYERKVKSPFITYTDFQGI